MNYGESIGIIGAVHGDWTRLHTALTALARHNIRKVVQLGGLGLVDDGLDWGRVPATLRRSLESINVKLLFLDGDRDPVRLRLRQMEPVRWYWRREQPRSLTSHLAYLPRGFRDQLSRNVRLAVFGGGDSDDPDVRIEEADLEALGPNHATVLLTHLVPTALYAPHPLTEVVAAPKPGDEPAPATALLYEALLAVRPRLVLSTGSSLVSRTLADRSSRGPFVTRFVLVPPVTAERIAGLILNTKSLALQVIDVEGETVDIPAEVTDLAAQPTGRWLLTTDTSKHIVDLDRRFWERLPGPNAPRYNAPNKGHIRTFEGLKVGRFGMIITEPDRALVEYYWAKTSLIRAIDQLNPHPDGDR